MIDHEAHQGVIKTFLNDKKFGFIVADNASIADIFFHQSALAFGTDESRLIRGARVRFVLGMPSPKGPNATFVELA